MMKWNIEWVDLKNIEGMVSECWRMNERQLFQYYKDLEQQQDLIFAGGLGMTFLEVMRDIITEQMDGGWSELQKDVHMIQKLIRSGQGWDNAAWKNQYQEIMDEPEFYFYTKLGRTFTNILAERLELHVAPDKKMLQNDIRQIQRVCEACDFNNETEVQKMIELLQSKHVFSSWVGEGFLQQLQDQFIKKEEELPDIFKELEPEPVPAPAPQPEKKRHFGIPRKVTFLLLVGISAASMGIWMYTQADRNLGIWELQQLMGMADTTVDKPSIQELKTTEKNLSGPDHENSIASEQTASDDEVLQEDGGTVAVEDDSDTAADEEDRVISKQDEIKTDVDTEQTDDGGKQPGAEEAQTDGQLDAEMEILPEYQAIVKEYPDVFGWLNIPGTTINVPVMKSVDKRYFYLHHDYTGKNSEEGSVFVEAASSCYPQDDNTVLYGHNMANGHIFGTLYHFEDPSYYQSHKTIQYDTIYEAGNYEIVAVLKTRVLYQDEPGFRYYQLYNYSTKDEFAVCKDFIKQNQLYDTGKELQYGDKTIMLSTCDYSQTNGRLVVVARRI